MIFKLTIESSSSNKTFTFVGNCNGYDSMVVVIILFSLKSYSTPASRLSDFVNHSYDDGLKRTQLSPITIKNHKLLSVILIKFCRTGFRLLLQKLAL